MTIGLCVQYHTGYLIAQTPFWCPFYEAELPPESVSSSTLRRVWTYSHYGCRLSCPPRILPWGECEPMATMAAGLHHSWGWAVPRVGVKFHLEGSVKLWPLQLHAYAIAVPGVSVQFHLEGSVKPWPLWLQACATAEAELSPESVSSSTSRGVEAPGHLGCRLVP